MTSPDIKKLKAGARGPRAIHKNYPEFYEFIMSNYPEELSFAEKLWWYTNQITKQPVCPTCGRTLKFIDGNIGYQKYCSSKCSANNKDVRDKSKQTRLEKYGNANYINREKAKQTCLERYGVENPLQCKETREKVKQTCLERYNSPSYTNREKAKQTCLERYGVDNPSQNKNIKNKVKQTCLERYGGLGNASSQIKEKVKQTCLERYGVDNPSQNKNIKNKVKQTCLERYGGLGNASSWIKEKAKQTCLERYGVEYSSQHPEIRKKVKQTCLERYGYTTSLVTPHCRQLSENIAKCKYIEKYKDHVTDKYFNGEDWINICKCTNNNCNLCKEKTFEIPTSLFYCRLSQNMELCTKLLPPCSIQTKNTTIEMIVKNILNKYDINYIENDRTVLGGKELDIYIPDYKLAIECNGIYWHSDKIKSKHYHYDKFINCQEQNIQLLTIWEDHLITKPEIIESIVLSKLGIYNTRIYARNCDIKEITPKESSRFLDNNHLQGNVKSSVKIGLYYNNELVSIMTFGKTRIVCGNKNKDGWELYRYCNKLNTQVVGGASKLLKYFVKKYNPKKIESFASNDISNGLLYNKLGFEKISQSCGSYWYIKDYIRYHRFKFIKSNLIKAGYDPNKTEFQIMDEIGYYRIFDSGQTKYILNVKYDK